MALFFDFRLLFWDIFGVISYISIPDLGFAIIVVIVFFDLDSSFFAFPKPYARLKMEVEHENPLRVV
jgi:hypothetical protein